MARYRVLTGLNYPDGSGGEKRAEVGEIVDDLPEKASKWLLRDGHIETVGKAAKATEATEEED